MIEDFLIGSGALALFAIVYLVFDTMADARRERELERTRADDRARRRADRQQHDALGQPIPWVDIDDGLDLSKLHVKREPTGEQ